jgi:hypothetical protein
LEKLRSFYSAGKTSADIRLRFSLLKVTTVESGIIWLGRRKRKWYSKAEQMIEKSLWLFGLKLKKRITHIKPVVHVANIHFNTIYLSVQNEHIHVLNHQK